MISKRRTRFVLPASEPYFADVHGEYATGAPTYGAYNYFSGLTSVVKRWHFTAALNAAGSHFGGRAIDFGAADGVLLPSLSGLFSEVWAIDRDPHYVAIAARVVDHHALRNVTLTCNQDGLVPPLPEGWSDGADVLFLLETLEHVGKRGRMWEARIEFVESLFMLLRPGGQIIITVPNMIGLGFLVQRVALRALRLKRERRISGTEFWRAVFFGDTTTLEARWKAPHGHLGFNHRRLEEALVERFGIVQRRHLFFQVLYVVQRRRR